MATTQKKIVNRIKSLTEVEDVKVEVTSELGHISISHRLHHTADFKFKWVDGNHYAGYFVDGDGVDSQAIVSLWSPMEAAKFIVLYAMLVELRAKRNQ